MNFQHVIRNHLELHKHPKHELSAVRNACGHDGYLMCVTLVHTNTTEVNPVFSDLAFSRSNTAKFLNRNIKQFK